MRGKLAYRLPPEFLAEFAQFKLPWKHDIPIAPDLSDSDWAAIEHFKWRAGEFLANVDDLNLPLVQESSLHLHVVRDGRARKGMFKSTVWPGRHRAKSVILDVRPLLLHKGNDSLSNLNRSANIVIRHTEDELLSSFVKNARNRFLSGDIKLSLSRDVQSALETSTIQGLIDLWFNAFYFHNGTQHQIDEAHRIGRIFDHNDVQKLLVHHILQGAHHVRCMFGVLQRTERSCPMFSRPHERILLRR